MALKSLNCGNYEVYIAKSGGTPLVCRLTGTTSIRFNRIINDYSEANVSVSLDISCRDCLSDVNPWQHEILIFRDSTLVWSGPITTLKYQPSESKVQIVARDLLAWTEKRLIELEDEDYEVYEVDVKEVFEWVLSHAYAKDPWNMTWDIHDTGVPIDRFYPGFYPPDRWGGLYQTCGEELRSLSSIGIDYTVINRVLYAGDLVIAPPSGAVIKVADQNWIKAPDITINGAGMSNRTVGAGGNGGYYGWYDDQIWIEETADPNIGLLETFTSLPDLTDSYTDEQPNAITQDVYSRHQFLRKPLAYISGGQLAGDAPFDFGDLIPGVLISVGLINSLRNLESLYRIASVDVDVSEESENISLTLTLPGVEGLKTE